MIPTHAETPTSPGKIQYPATNSSNRHIHHQPSSAQPCPGLPAAKLQAIRLPWADALASQAVLWVVHHGSWILDDMGMPISFYREAPQRNAIPAYTHAID